MATVKNVCDRRDFTQFKSSGIGRRRGTEAGQDEQYVHSAMDCITANQRSGEVTIYHIVAIVTVSVSDPTVSR